MKFEKTISNIQVIEKGIFLDDDDTIHFQTNGFLHSLECDGGITTYNPLDSYSGDRYTVINALIENIKLGKKEYDPFDLKKDVLYAVNVHPGLVSELVIRKPMGGAVTLHGLPVYSPCYKVKELSCNIEMQR